jgi:hypothetical protein
MSDPNRPADEPTDTDAEADQPVNDPPLYPVAAGPDLTAVCEGEIFPRRIGHGRRGVLLVDRGAGLVYLLDADDERQVFVGRDRRQLVGDPADVALFPEPGVDHVVRAAVESEYDVIAAPWAGEHVDHGVAVDQGEAVPHGDDR